MNWIDLLVLSSEERLESAIRALNSHELDGVIDDLCANLDLDDLSIKLLTLRLLLERARILAIPNRVWRRSPEDSWSVAEESGKHHRELGNTLTSDQTAALQKFYFQCKKTRGQLRISAELLGKNDYRCGLCGLRFFNEDLEHLAISSPHGYRQFEPKDLYKPHYANRRRETTYPAVDHIWPVSLYGGNGKSNQNILCHGCNTGKSNHITYAHSRPVVGHPNSKDLQAWFRVSFDVFYSRIAASPTCSLSGKSWRETELTVRPVREGRALVCDNLMTVSYEALDGL